MSAGGGPREHGAAPHRPGVGLLALLAGAASIGAGAIAVRAAYRHGASPTSLVVARLALAGIPFALALPWLLRRTPGPLPWRHLGLAAASGVCLLLGSHCELQGLQLLPAAVLVLLLFAAPVWVVLIERTLWGRRVRSVVLAAIALTVTGLVTMVAPWTGGLDPIGVAWGLGGSLALAVFFVLLDRSQALLTTTVAVSSALAAAGTVALLSNPGGLGEALGNSDVRPYALAVAAASAGWGLLASVGLRETSPVTATVVGAAEPVFVAVFAFLLLGETLSPREVAGGGVVIAGVFLAALGPPWVDRHRRAALRRQPPAVPPAPGNGRPRDRQTLRR